MVDKVPGGAPAPQVQMRTNITAEQLAAAANMLIGAQAGQMIAMGLPMQYIIDSILTVVIRIIGNIPSPVERNVYVDNILRGLNSAVEAQAAAARTTAGGIILPQGAPPQRYVPLKPNGKG